MLANLSQNYEESPSWHLPPALFLAVECGHLNLHTIDTIDTVNEEDCDEYERDLRKFP